MTKVTKILILTHQEVGDLLPIRECMPVMAEALADLARGNAYQPLRMIVTPPGAAGDIGLMPSYRAGERAAYGVKAVCVFPDNPAKGLDSHQGSVMLFSGRAPERSRLEHSDYPRGGQRDDRRVEPIC